MQGRGVSIQPSRFRRDWVNRIVRLWCGEPTFGRGHQRILCYFLLWHSKLRTEMELAVRPWCFPTSRLASRSAQNMGISRAARQDKENTRNTGSAELCLALGAIALRACIQQTQQTFIQHLPYAREFYTHYRRHYPTLEIRKLRLRKVKEIAQGHKAS